MDNLELSKAFIGPGGGELMLWLCEHGHINEVIEEQPTALIEHNLVVRLLHDAGFALLPIAVKQEEREETNVIDTILENEDA